MSWLSSIGSSLAQGVSHFLHNLIPEAEEAVHEEPSKTTPPPTASTESLSPDTSVPVRTVTSDQTTHLSLEKVLSLHRLYLSTQHDYQARNLVKEIDPISHKLTTLDEFMKAFAKQLAEKRSVDLHAQPFPRLVQQLQTLGVTLPENTVITVENSSPILQALEHQRDEWNQERQMKIHKLTELNKQHESVLQMLLAMVNRLQEVERGIFKAR